MQETLVHGIVKIKWDKVYKPYSKDSMSKGYDEFGGGILLFICFGCAVRPVWSQFPDQELNLRPLQ